MFLISFPISAFNFYLKFTVPCKVGNNIFPFLLGDVKHAWFPEDHKLFWTSNAGRKPSLSDSKPGELSVTTSFHSEVSEHLKIVIVLVSLYLMNLMGERKLCLRIYSLFVEARVASTSDVSYLCQSSSILGGKLVSSKCICGLFS